MKVFNKNNFTINTLAPGQSNYAKSNLHITHDFTEVTNGHYIIRVYSKDQNDDLPETGSLKPSK